MINSSLVVLIAICAITLLESIALLKGLDGHILTVALAFIAGLGGYEIKEIIRAIRGIKKEK